MPDSTGERYTLHTELGCGGMSTVYRAWDSELHAWRAVKVLPGTASPSLRERFVREARAMARLQSVHIVPIHDILERDGSLWLVMELMPGGSLAQRVEQHGLLSCRIAVHCLLPVLSTLSDAHRSGIVHRDIKPHNLLIDAHGAVLLSDFGIARLLSDDTLTVTGAAFGTPAFMAPEQRRDAGAMQEALADIEAELPEDAGERPLLAGELPTFPPPPLHGGDTVVEPTLSQPIEGAKRPRQRELWLALCLPLLAGLGTSAAIRWARVDEGAVGERWRITERASLRPSDLDSVRHSDGRLFSVVEGQLWCDGRPLVPQCAADYVIEAKADRLLLARGEQFVVVDPRCHQIESFPDHPTSIFALHPAGGLLVIERDRIVHRTTNDRTLVAGSSINRAPGAISPAGRFFAWLSNPVQSEPALMLLDQQKQLSTEIDTGSPLVQMLGVRAITFLDEQTLAFARNAGPGRTEILSVSLDSGQRSLLATLDTEPVYSIVGTRRQIWLRSLGANYDIDTLGPSGVQSLVTGPGSDRPSGYLEDGTLLYSSNALGSWDVWQVTPQGEKSVLIGGPTDDAWAVAHRNQLLWLQTHPDEVRVQLRGSDGVERTLASLPPPSGNVAHIPPPDQTRLGCSEEACVIGLLHDQQTEVYDLDVATGHLKHRITLPITIPGQYVSTVAPDGTVVVRDGSVVLLLPAGGFGWEKRTISRDIQYLDALDDRWLTTGKHEGRWFVSWLDADGHFTDIVTSEDWLGHPQATADGAHIAWLTTRKQPVSYTLVSGP